MPTDKQTAFIEKLRAERVTTGATALLERPVESLTVREGSRLIDELLSLPRKPAESGHLAGLEQARYAFTWERLHLAGLAHLAGHNEQAFFRVKNWRERVFLDQLKGAAPAFTRVRLSKADEAGVAALIRAHALEAVLLFSQTYTCCARCGAELTDQRSIDTGLGPTCRGHFGL